MKKEKYKVETFLPLFSGFYGTVWDDYFENEIEWLIDSKDYPNLKDYDSVFDVADWESSYADLAESIFWSIFNELSGLNYVDSMEFQKVVSPKYYNYTNDSINIKITLTGKNIQKIQSVVNEYFTDFKSYVKEATTSRSGFIPYYRPTDFIDFDNETVKKEALLHEHHLGFTLEFLLDIEGIEEFYLDVDFVPLAISEEAEV